MTIVAPAAVVMLFFFATRQITRAKHTISKCATCAALLKNTFFQKSLLKTAFSLPTK
jgi:hypothetical protein